MFGHPYERETGSLMAAPSAELIVLASDKIDMHDEREVIQVVVYLWIVTFEFPLSAADTWQWLPSSCLKNVISHQLRMLVPIRLRLHI